MRHRRKILTAALAGLLIAALVPQTPATAAAFGSETRSYIVKTKHGGIYLEVSHPTKNGKIVKAPTVLTYSPYSVLGRNGDASKWNSMGIAQAYADVVGTGNSGGCYDYGGKREKETGHTLVEYIHKAKWSTGKIAMMGGSYDGTTATATAITKPKGLVTIVPIAAISRWYGYAYAGGMRYTYTNEFAGNTGPFAATDEGFDTPAAFDFGLAVPPPTDVEGEDWAGRVQSTIVPCDEIEHTQRGYDDTPDYTKFWKERDYIAGARKLKIPVLVAHNWGDWNVKQDEGWNLFNALRGKNKKMYFGTRWSGHGSPGGKFDEVVDKWMRHYLLGEKNGIQNLARVTTQTSDWDGAGKWFSGNRVKAKNMRLTFQQNLSTKENAPNWVFLPHKPDLRAYGGGVQPAQAGWPITNGNVEYHAGFHPRMNHEWLWAETPPLKKPLRIFGEIKIKIRGKSDREWVTLTPSLYDFNHSVHKMTPGPSPQHYTDDQRAGVAMSRAFLDTRYRDGLGKQKMLAPNKPFEVQLSAHPQDYTFKKGHSIGINFQTEIAEWAMPKPYACTSAECLRMNLEWTKGDVQIILPVAGGGDVVKYFGHFHH
jgi:putative CocE/NonD family hydrolase